MTAERAHLEAKKLLGRIATGIDPIAERKEKKVKSITLKETDKAWLPKLWSCPS